MVIQKKRSLGKGLKELGISELLNDLNTTVESAQAQHAFRLVPIENLQPGKYQPRRDIKPAALEELAASIRVQGILQPLIVRPIYTHHYEIIAGERRWRAAQLAGLTEVPVIIRDIPDETAIAVALIENIQRENLNPLEEAVAIHRLIHEFNLTHEQAAEVVGKARASVTNLLRLLQLNAEVKVFLENGQLEMGHARALLTLQDSAQIKAAKIIIEKRLSVRDSEALVRKLLQPSPAIVPSERRLDPNIVSLQAKLSDQLGAAVTIQQQANGKGQLIIRYNSLDELEGILQHIQ